MWNNQSIIDWISREGRLFEDPVELLDGLMATFNGNGFEIARMRIALQALHPQVAVWSYTWDRQTGARPREVTHSIHESNSYFGSPIEEVNLHGKLVRIRLAKINRADHHHVVGELIDMG